jgi:hypothetical protein
MKKTSPGTRLDVGASVLAAARAIDTRPVQDRLRRFEQAHRSYVGAQRKVDVAQSQIRAAQARLVELDVAQNEAIEELARALVSDRQPRSTPFDAFGAPGPGTLTHLPLAQKPAAVHGLVAAIVRSHGTSDATTRAAEAADKAARDLDEALPPLAKLQANIRDARRMRDAVGQTWEAAITALRRVARAAEDEGAPDLYGTLFAPATKAGNKTKAPEEPASPTETPAATTNAA